MHATTEMKMFHTGLKQFERNRYFFGKMLDEFHFRLETDYHNGKRWLINRAVLGYGVVCGLDVVPASDQDDAIIITPGFAIDKWGREIIVPEATRPIQIPPDVIAKLNSEIAKVMQSAEMKKQLLAQGVEARSSTPEQFGTFIKSETAKWGKVIADAGIKE